MVPRKEGEATKQTKLNAKGIYDNPGVLRFVVPVG